MKSSRWVDRWRLRRIIATLAIPLNDGGKPGVHDFAKTMEATEIMTRGVKNDTIVSLQVSRDSLDQFIRYMCSLHDSKLHKLATARVALATIMEPDEAAIGGNKKEVLREEAARTHASGKLKVVDAGGEKFRVKV